MNTEILDGFAKYAPQYLPLLGAILVVLFTRNYVYKGMIPESILESQIQRETKHLQELSDRDLKILEGAKDIEGHLSEIVRQMEGLTSGFTTGIQESNARMTALERFLSDQIDAIRDLEKNCQLHRAETLKISRELKEKQA